MYVERGMEEIVCLKMEMGLHEEEEREFDKSLTVFVLKRERVFFFLILSGFGFVGEGNFRFFRL